MREWDKAQEGFLYLPEDVQIKSWLMKCKDLCFEYNRIRPSDVEQRKRILRKLFGEIGGDLVVEPPFWCDYGFNISVGRDFYANHNCVILDAARVIFGNEVFIGPDCVFSTAGHAIDPLLRAKGFEIAEPITVGDRVWFGAGVIVLPGVSIGTDSIIGAGSIVNRDIPAGVIAAGNPVKVIRKITQEDRNRYLLHPDDAQSLGW